MSLTKYALQCAQLLFRISFLSLVTTRLSSHSFPQLHSALNSEFNSEAKMLDFVPPIGRSVSLGVYGAASAAAKRDKSLDKCWALSRPSDAQRLWGSMGQWAGLGWPALSFCMMIR
ncbi:hypothetical protein ILYODFUR_035944 [Ilyodon furcidens]|uniref:Secreted protein n=1 Tax=Ilyodon furcidens TaxID=33524 RepID=A0ABV0T312_9TELE